MLCLTAQTLKLNCGVSYKRHSDVNEPLYGAVDTAMLADATERLRAEATRVGQDFDSAMERTSRRLDRRIAKTQGKIVVKGKWLPAYFAHCVRSALDGKPAGTRNLATVALKSHLHALDFAGEWSNPFRDRMAALVESTS